ncbi:hypothetical protein [Mycolicibacterium sp.]|uniref:hypothetical protein n=1 Tax=Mycolicibacterium sp. TaxID=2320850 RepID=UPI0025DE6D69|nr:hypothetical protein [Mycolicibacterium sp.]
MSDESDDSQNTRPISVAELLARNGTIGAPPAGGRRHRRRGNADAISVSELTAEIPIIRDEPVAEVPAVDVPAVEESVAEVPAVEESVAEVPAVEESVADSEPAASAATVVIHSEAEESAATVILEEGDTEAPAEEVDDAPIEESAAEESAVEEVAVEEVAVEGDLAEDDRVAADLVEESVVEEVVVEEAPAEESAVAEDLVAEDLGEEDIAEDEPGEDEPVEEAGPPQLSEEPLPRRASGPELSEYPRPVRMTSGAEQMAPDPVDESVDLDALLAEQGEDAEELRSYLEASSGALFSGETMADDIARRGVRTETRKETVEEAVDTAAPVEAERGRTGGFRHMLAAVFQSVLAVAFGAGLFLAFDQLWRWNTIVALVLSVLVILGLVVAVRVVRKTEDIGSTLIAVAVGALITLGPLALLQST